MKHNAKSSGCRVLRDESGQSLVIVSVFMGLVGLGFMAFALDVGMLFRENRMVQSAAEAAAVAAAEQAGTGQASNEQTVANAMAKLNGFDTTKATDPAVVTLSAPTHGNFTGAYVQATVSMPVHTYFLGAFSKALATVPVSATAIAGGGVISHTCICVKGNLSVSGGSTLSASGCGIFDNSTSPSSIQMSGGSSINAYSLAGAATGWYPCNLGLSHGCDDSGDKIDIPTIEQGVTSTCSTALPPAPAFTPSSCATKDPGNGWVSPGTLTMGPATPGGTICYGSKGLTIGGNGMVDTLTSGIYVINGGELHFSSDANLGGNGVFFYLTNGAKLVMDGGSGVNLVAGGAAENGGGTAPSLGAYDGILIYQDPSDTSAMTMNSGSNPYINGTIVAPSSSLSISGGSSSANGMQGGFFVNNLSVTGGSVGATVGASQGSLSIPSASPTLVQ